MFCGIIRDEYTDFLSKLQYSSAIPFLSIEFSSLLNNDSLSTTIGIPELTIRFSQCTSCVRIV